MRVTVDLVECEHGEAVWSERFERSLTDLFAVQDDMADAIVAALQPQIERAEQERTRFLATEHLGAWECYHRALWHGFRFTRADNERASELLHRALELDPDFARAHAGLSFNLFSRVFLDASADPRSDLQRALDSARHSVSLEPRDALGHWSLGRALFLAGEHDQALAALDRSLAANPNYAQGHYARGFVACHHSMPDQAVSDLDMARRLSPFDPLLFAMEASRAITLAVGGHYPEAVEWAVQATREPNAHFHIFAIAAACLELAGRHEEAARNVAQALAMHPGYSVAVFQRSVPHKAERARRTMSDALAAAGLPCG
jgi:tetratricopeptide (TPR) repeat protein